MKVLCAKDAGEASGGRRPLEGFLRGKPRKAKREEGVESGQVGEAGEGAESSPDQQPFGFYRPDPEVEERDRVARRLWKQVFG